MSVTNVNKLNCMPYNVMGLISSFNPSEDARTMVLVSKHLQSAKSWMQPTAERTWQKSIPLDSFSLLFSFLPKQERVGHQVVCTSFREAQLRAPTALCYEDSDITDAQLIKILEKDGDKYAHIALINCPKLTGKAIERLAQLKGLTSLNLSDNTFTDKDLLPLTTPRIFAPKNKEITDKELGTLLHTNGDKFGHIDITGCHKLTSDTLKKLARLKQLRSLDVTPDQFSDRDLARIRQKKIRIGSLNCSSIVSLNLSRNKLTGKCFEGFGQLLRLDLTGCPNITSTCFDSLRKCANLRTLTLASTAVTDDNMKNIKNIKSLKKLDVSNCQKITDTTVRYFNDKIVSDNLELVTDGCPRIHRRPKGRIEKTASKHNIPNPLPADVEQSAQDIQLALNRLKQWKGALQEKRIGELFKTSEGLKGHIQQVQYEINRFPSSVHNRPKQVSDAAIKTLQYVRDALGKAMQGAVQNFKAQKENSFLLPQIHTIKFPAWSAIPDLVI